MNTFLLLIGGLIGIIINARFLIYAEANPIPVSVIYLITYSISLLTLFLIYFFSRIIDLKTNEKDEYKYNTNQEFKNIFNELKKKYFTDLEILRKNIFKRKLQATICFYLVIVQISLYAFCKFIITFLQENQIANSAIESFTGTLWIPIIIAIVLAIKIDNRSTNDEKEYINLFKEKIVSEFIKWVNPNLQYFYKENEKNRRRAPDIGIEYINAEFDGGVTNYIVNNDIIEGQVSKDYYFKMSEITARKFDRTQNVNSEVPSFAFDGLFTWIETKKDIKNCLRINWNGNNVKFSAEDEYVALDHAEFEEIFDVYCSDKILAVRILTVDIMQDIMDFYTKYNLMFEICYRNDKVYMRFYTDNMFEPKIVGDSMNINTLYMYYEIINFVIEIVQKMGKMAETIEI